MASAPEHPRGGALILAGGGHSHALLLRRWAMQPERRPSGLITLVNRSSTALYSGMVPGLIARRYSRREVAIDLRRLADQAGVALVIAEISGLDLQERCLHLRDRPALTFDQLSLDVGAVSASAPAPVRPDARSLIPIKPLEPALALLEREDQQMQEAAAAMTPFCVIGAGLAGVEVALALRQRWPTRPLALYGRPNQPHPAWRQALNTAGIACIEAEPEHSGGPGLLCTGSRAPGWLAASGLPCCPSTGRVLTGADLQVLGHPGLWASGDCGLIEADPRPPSGVWAVRAARPLARSLERLARDRQPRPWRPQRRALQLVGGSRSGQPVAWMLWGPLRLGPHPWLWRWKESIDRRFMERFRARPLMKTSADAHQGTMRCRGCAAKVPAATLEMALRGAGLNALGAEPEDANPLPASTGPDGGPVLQSVDGFPALVSDPWLNGRLTTLHACSDLWACGARVTAAQAVVTLPIATSSLQQALLSQTLAGIRSALEPQSAQLIGGHTLEERDPSSTKGDDDPLSQRLQVLLSVTGSPCGHAWPKRGLQAGDQLLLSRPLGTGVLFAAAMAGAGQPQDLDAALAQMSRSQHPLLEQLQAQEQQYPGQLHAATDITGFGLIGHLGEMLGDPQESHHPLQVHLDAEAIPALTGALPLLEAGHASSLAPANRRAWALLDRSGHQPATLQLALGSIVAGSPRHRALLELLVDPQTCGPLLIAVTPVLAEQILAEAWSEPWAVIGRAMAG